jgi:hypothetical protein
MMSLTAQEYYTAAKVFERAYGDKIDEGGWITLHLRTVGDYFEEQAEKSAAREMYARGLVGLQVPSANSLYNGNLILKRLLNDGWTPPEGLF